MKDNKFDTIAIHGKKKHKNAKNALNPPIFQTSTFVFDSIEHVEKVMSFESDDYVYTRGNNPTLRLFEDRMADLENGKGAVAFASGMAAISSVLFSLLRPGENALINKTIYGSSYNVFTKVLPKYNIDYIVGDLSDVDNLANMIDENTRLIYFETPSNPNLMIIDIKKIVSFAKKNNIKVVIDNTFASPFFQNPLNMGVDVVVHSATKYICGHGDVIAGVAVANDIDYINELKFDYMCEFGGVLSPFNAWLLLRGIKTLSIRMRQHEKNALKISRYLENHNKIKNVMYPGLESFKDHKIAKEQMSGFGAIIAFEVHGGLEAAKRVVNNVKLMQLAVSLGDCETLIELPVAMTHRGYDAKKLDEFGLTESMIRISVGLEDVDDIIKDIEQALKMV